MSCSTDLQLNASNCRVSAAALHYVGHPATALNRPTARKREAVVSLMLAVSCSPSVHSISPSI